MADRRVAGVVLALAGVVSAPLPSIAQPPTACEQLAAHARQLPDTAWTQGYKALASDLRLEPEAKTPLAKQIAAAPAVVKALNDEDGGWAVQVMRVPGADLYMASVTSGTLECQQLQFVQVGGDGRLSLAAAPPAYGDLCWTSWAETGQPLGSPALVEIEGYDAAGLARQSLEITPWTDKGWGSACSLTLNYRAVFTLKERFCGSPAICAAVAPKAADIARDYNRQGNPALLSVQPPPTAAGKAAFARFAPNADGSTSAPQFPTFDAKPTTEFPDYSYNNVTLFPLTLDGATYVAAVGYGGVGWRDIGDMLLAVYAPDGDQLQPLAGFVITRQVVGLESAEVSRPKPVPPQG
jgi:hypothetical protein